MNIIIPTNAYNTITYLYSSCKKNEISRGEKTKKNYLHPFCNKKINKSIC